ncbi:amino acid transporter, partial [Tilletiaria anomala UBC 951]
ESLPFGFRDHLLPLTLSSSAAAVDVEFELEEYDAAGRLSRLHPSSPSRSPSSRARAPPERRMTLFDGVALTVGLQIGSGIFSSPGVVTLNAGSVGASLSVWLLSGLLAWTGAASFAELGAAIPLNGGAQAYLTYSFGELAGYLFAWIAITALKPGSGAIIASIFAEYVARIAYHAKAHASASITQTQPELQDIPPWLIKLIALALTVLLSTLHALSTRLSTRFQNISTALKLLALFAVPVAAGVQVARRGMPEQSHAAFGSWDGFWKGSARSPGAYALALYSGLWSFDGWDQVSLVGGEMKNVKRDLPRVIHISLCLVLMIFLLVVTSYFLVLPPALVARTNTVALDFGAAILGPSGGVVFALLVAFSCLGALNSQFYTTARLVYVAAREGYLPSVFARLHARTRTPLNAIVLQNVLVALFLLFGSGFASIVNFYGVCSWLFYFATVSGLLVLRVKEPNLERPYKTYLSTPILFSAVALFLLFMPIFSAPLEALAAFVFISAGVPMYYLTQQR